MAVAGKEQLEELRKQYPKGTEISFDYIDTEDKLVTGVKCKVEYIDDAGRIHTRLENGRGVFLIPFAEEFHKTGIPKKKKKEEPSR